jgi:hypothetical protein
MNQNDKLKQLSKLEKEAKIDNLNQSSEELDENIDSKNINSENKPNLLDGYRIIEREDLPQKGCLYPESWKFAYRCPTSKEVAIFSTINEQDKPAILNAVEDLIRKCVIVYDIDTDKQISSGQIIDAHRVFFILLLREFYLPGSPITFPSMCTLEKEKIEVTLNYTSLIFKELNEKILNAYDGRKFSLKMPEIEEPIEFLCPTIEITSRLFKYVIKVFKDAQNDSSKKDNVVFYDKNFLLIAPYLYTTGLESVKEITNRYSKILKDDKLFKAYMEISVKIKLENLEYFEATCPKCGSVEETQIRFPGGWKNMFISTKDDSGYFD